MDKLNHLLRRLTPNQIIAAAIATWIVMVALVIFGIGPLATMLLLPFGEAVAAVVGFLVYFAGGFVVGHYVGKVFATAYYERKYDDELQRITVEFAESKARG